MTSPSERSIDLPGLLEDLIAGAEANLTKIRTICARASLRVECDEFERALDRDGNSFRTQTANFALWQDGQRVRIDRTFDRTFDLRNNSIVYRFSMVDVVGTVRSEDAKSFVTQHGTPRETIRYLRADGREYIYCVESEHVLLRHSHAPYPIMAELKWLTGGATVHDRTLRALVAETLRRKMDVALEDVGCRGRALTISTVYNLADGNRIPTSTRILIDPQRGNTVQRVEVQTGGSIGATVDYEYANRGGAWVVVDGDERELDPASGRTTRRTTLHVEMDSLRINDAIDPTVFDPDGLGIAKGALVHDQARAEPYLHDDVSITEKIRMNQRGRH
jgi:hypothetical protein